MSDLIGNPEDRFPRVAAHLTLYSFQTDKMKHVLALCLAISFIAAMAEASRHPSSAPRSFKAFLEAKIRRIYDGVVDLKQEVEECCNKAGSVRFFHLFDYKS